MAGDIEHYPVHPCIVDLTQEARMNGERLSRSGPGGIELAFYRGFEGGYEQAMLDHKNGCMKKDYAHQSSRAK